MKHHSGIASLICLAIILFLIALVQRMDHGILHRSPFVRPFLNGSSGEVRELPSFEQIALKYGNDKVTTHSCQYMYEKYISPVRDLPLKLLEIGLGCNMDYGPGASYYTWLEYLPNVELYFIEVDHLCAKKYQDKTINAHVFIGDQADVDFLNKFAADVALGGLFDIIDDGGHTMQQQMTSLEVLWPVVKPGGLYVIEDLQTSYWGDYGGDSSGKDAAKLTTMKYLYELLDDMMTQNRSTKLVGRDLLELDCMPEICTLQKKNDGMSHIPSAVSHGEESRRAQNFQNGKH